jgi:hypothetical protein
MISGALSPACAGSLMMGGYTRGSTGQSPAPPQAKFYRLLRRLEATLSNHPPFDLNTQNETAIGGSGSC